VKRQILLICFIVVLFGGVQAQKKTVGGQVFERSKKEAESFFYAVRHGKRNRVVKFLKTRPGKLFVNETHLEKTALYWAVLKGNYWVVKLLLNTQGVLLNKGDIVSGMTPFHSALEKGYDGIATLFLDTLGVDKNKSDKSGRTPLMTVAGQGRVDMISTLVDRGAMLTSRDKRGRTALHYAAMHGKQKAVKYLLELGWLILFKGDDYHEWVHAKDKDGNTALGLALKVGNKEVEDEFARSAKLQSDPAWTGPKPWE